MRTDTFRWIALLPALVFGSALAVAQPKPAPVEAGAPPQRPLERGALSGRIQSLDYYYDIKPDCTAEGPVEVRIVTPPAHGTLTVERGVDYPNFSRDNVRYECNRQEVPVVKIYYRSEAGYSGADSVAIDILYADGKTRHTIYSVDVWASAYPAAGQPAR